MVKTTLIVLWTSSRRRCRTGGLARLREKCPRALQRGRHGHDHQGLRLAHRIASSKRSPPAPRWRWLRKWMAPRSWLRRKPSVSSANDVIPLERAIPYFSDLIERDPQDVCNYSRTTAFFRPRVNTIARSRITARPSDCARRWPRFMSGVGCASWARKIFPRTMSDFAEASELDPKSAGAYLGRSGTFCETGDYARGFPTCERQSC